MAFMTLSPAHSRSMLMDLHTLMLFAQEVEKQLVVVLLGPRSALGL